MDIIAVARNILELEGTIDTGVDYIREQVADEAKSDVINGIMSVMVDALEAILLEIKDIEEEFPGNNVNEFHTGFVYALSAVKNVCSTGGIPDEQLLNVFRDSFVCYDSELKRCLEPYVLC
ncbi:sensory box histidine kinase [Syntrophobotulus glycolicus DSM 8271]|uniref:Sensory box histidine kinase n=1 Tax=Syntrophobotulus glycolicus (strain DSM 8271 / FlGlyR) TaxID=645991 RepID=F0SX62_SYNGF|nr:hypothetical protein [Syntrophobotulus glycolicus]ADY56922.1 sensory box histidine kinase [Syntrophobotulus glycolicus DSM 8271]